MSGKKIFIIIISVGIVAALAIYIVRRNAVAVQSNAGTQSSVPSGRVANSADQSQPTPVSQQASQSGTSEQQPPQPQKKFPDDYSLTKPDQMLSMGNSGQSLRIFNVSLSALGFTPSEIVVNQNDVVQINLHAGSVPVDLNSYELHTYLWAPAGQTQSGSIVLPTSGLFLMSCKNNCAGANSPTLTFAVLPK